MAKRKKGGRAGRVAFAILVTLAVLAAAFFLIMRGAGRTSVLENASGSLLAPIQNAFSAATTYVRDLVRGAKDYGNMSYELQLAELQIQELQLRVDSLEEAALENERLTSALEAKERYETLDPVYAYVIAREPGVWFDTFSINRGELDGVQVDMAVITGDGLVGRVIEVGMSYAKVLSLIDSRSAVSCLIERTRDNGVLRGQISSASRTSECRMYYLPYVNDIVPGDKVLTSGVDTLFPKGITVGTVTAISRQSDSADQYVVVEPSVDFLRIEEVLVLRTVVETDAEPLPVLLTPTPRPTNTPSVTPTPIPGTETDTGEDSNWVYPTLMPDTVWDPTPTPAPTETPILDLPEDAWASAE